MRNERTLKLSTIINLYSCFFVFFMFHNLTGPQDPNLMLELYLHKIFFNFNEAHTSIALSIWWCGYTTGRLHSFKTIFI